MTRRTEQLPLFRRRWHQRLHDRLMSRLLWMANSSPPACHRQEFYALKDWLLKRYSDYIGQDVQHIRKSCWTCDGTGIYETGKTGDTCRRCGGSGRFDEFWVYLSRWQFGGRVFHRPELRTRIKPGEPVTIEGYVQHAQLGRSATEAALWLALLHDRRLFWRMLTRGGTYLGWYWLPLCNVQRAVFRLRSFAHRFKPRRCGCGRRCRKPGVVEMEDVPF